MSVFDWILTIIFGAAIVSSIIYSIVNASKAKRVHSNKKKIITNKERAGIQGEVRAAGIINSVLENGDLLFQNVEISVDNRPAEFDSIVVNQYGVYIFEVKNYKGTLEGTEEDYEWKKYNTSEAGNTYEKKVKNPIKQVKREIYLLAQYLKRHGVKVWVDGYAILLNNNSPVFSEHIVGGSRDVDRVIHTSRRNKLTGADIKRITKLLQ